MVPSIVSTSLAWLGPSASQLRQLAVIHIHKHSVPSLYHNIRFLSVYVSVCVGVCGCVCVYACGASVCVCVVEVGCLRQD